ncbi:nitroreductase family protein [Anaerosphaera multitolerans]|uniref:Nitroreductase n=1 Tax=Anaerosphaera multitolerans TaxID=2487351 RepID=A0A437S934_9FIRM|nr:nitroreductase family protein [Anaerosphaera multitolerans]RVU55374.1 nitroreductase [Anaerosphaera multitolerans]
MVMTTFLQKRRSVRDFKDVPLPDQFMTTIKSYISLINDEKEDVNYEIYEDGQSIYNGLVGKAGYAGVMIKAPHYVAFIAENDDPKTFIDIGYYLEKLNEKITNLNLATCWITVDEVDSETMEKLFGENGTKVKYLVAFGYPVPKMPLVPLATSTRLDVKEIVFTDEIGQKFSIDDLYNRGLFNVFSSIRFAPSYKNLQPWRFVVRGEYVYLYMIKTEDRNHAFTDIGVVMFYFEEMVKTIGMYGKWEVELEEGEEYTKIGKFKM